MYINTYVYKYMYIYTYIYIYILHILYLHAYTYTNISTCISMFTCIHIKWQYPRKQKKTKHHWCRTWFFLSCRGLMSILHDNSLAYCSINPLHWPIRLDWCNVGLKQHAAQQNGVYTRDNCWTLFVFAENWDATAPCKTMRNFVSNWDIPEHIDMLTLDGIGVHKHFQKEHHIQYHVFHIEKYHKIFPYFPNSQIEWTSYWLYEPTSYSICQFYEGI